MSRRVLARHAFMIICAYAAASVVSAVSVWLLMVVLSSIGWASRSLGLGTMLHDWAPPDQTPLITIASGLFVLPLGTLATAMFLLPVMPVACPWRWRWRGAWSIVAGWQPSVRSWAGCWHRSCSPRRPRSKWSAVNRSRAEHLIGHGLMRMRGLKEIEAARADGRWAAAYPPSSAATIPVDLQTALDDYPAAAARFAALNRTARYQVLLGLANVRKAETRARRMAVFVAGSEPVPTSAQSGFHDPADDRGPARRKA